MKTQIAFKHDFDGNCKPGSKGWWNNKTFSVGIFQWLPKSGGKGLKRSAVKYRVKGKCDVAEIVYARAAQICVHLDAGLILTKKSESIS